MREIKDDPLKSMFTYNERNTKWWKINVAIHGQYVRFGDSVLLFDEHHFR